MEVMLSLYASVTATTTLQVRNLASIVQPSSFVGQVMFYDIERERGADPATALTRRLTRFGAITSCIVYPRDVIGPFDAHVTFDSAAAAEACVTHLRCVEGETNVALFYNSTPYSSAVTHAKFAMVLHYVDALIRSVLQRPISMWCF